MNKIIKSSLLDNPNIVGSVDIRDVLSQSLSGGSFFQKQIIIQLEKLGLTTNDALCLITAYKSEIKYGYRLSVETLHSILELKNQTTDLHPINRLSRSPYFLMKLGWIYEHAPFFFFYQKHKKEQLDQLLLDFCKLYYNEFFHTNAPIHIKKCHHPRDVLATYFWESKVIDPIELIKKTNQAQIKGFELSIDFLPFNFTKLLPEDFTPEKRKAIYTTGKKANVQIDIHSPIVGPYMPTPNPAKGSQIFFDPIKNQMLQTETFYFARDIGARSVVLHLIDLDNLKEMVQLIEKGADAGIRVTLENYCQIDKSQKSAYFLDAVNEIVNMLPNDIRKNHFGITLDVGHYNIEGDDPLVSALSVGKFCLKNDVFLRMHATDNYGNLLFSPPAFSADVHANVSGKGINNSLIIKLLNKLGLKLDVVAEQIQPLTPHDIQTIHDAQTFQISKPYREICSEGKNAILKKESGLFERAGAPKSEAYHFLAGLEGIDSLHEYLVYRRIQNNNHLSVDEAKKISQDFIKLPQTLKASMMNYIDDLLLPIQIESGAIQKNDLDLVCQNISGTLFGTINTENLNNIFNKEKSFQVDQVICYQNEPGKEMFLIKSGQVDVHIDDNHLASLGPGEVVGEICLFYNINRSATLIAKKEATVIGILNRTGLEDMFINNKVEAYELIFRLYNILPERLRNLNEKYKSAINALELMKKGDHVSDANFTNTVNLNDLSKVNYFKTLNIDQIKALFNEDIYFSKHQTVFHEQESPNGAYYIVDGQVQVASLTEDKTRVILAELNPGEIFGEMALIDDKPRSASINTLSDCHFKFISKTSFNQFINSGSDQAYLLMGYICLSLFRSILRLDKLYSEIKQQI